MELITKEQIIANVAANWRRSYPHNYNLANNESSDAIWHRLKEATTEKEINTIIGNESWTRNECAECGKDAEAVVAFDHYEERVQVCKKCLGKALKLVKDL
jgi:hypothetical protein